MATYLLALKLSLSLQVEPSRKQAALTCLGMHCMHACGNISVPESVPGNTHLLMLASCTAYMAYEAKLFFVNDTWSMFLVTDS